MVRFCIFRGDGATRGCGSFEGAIFDDPADSSLHKRLALLALVKKSRLGPTLEGGDTSLEGSGPGMTLSGPRG